MSDLTPEQAIAETRARSQSMLSATAARLDLPTTGPVDATLAWRVFLEFVQEPLAHRERVPMEDRAEVEVSSYEGRFSLRLSRTTIVSDVDSYPDDPEGTILISMILDWGDRVADGLWQNVPPFQLAPAGGAEPLWTSDPTRPHEHQTLEALQRAVNEGPLETILSTQGSTIEFHNEEA